MAPVRLRNVYIVEAETSAVFRESGDILRRSRVHCLLKCDTKNPTRWVTAIELMKTLNSIECAEKQLFMGDHLQCSQRHGKLHPSDLALPLAVHSSCNRPAMHDVKGCWYLVHPYTT